MMCMTWTGIIFFLLLLVCLFLPGMNVEPKRERRCPRTHANATRKAVLGFRGRNYEIFTCSDACAKSLQTLAESSEEAFAEKYQVKEETSDGIAGIHLSNHINRQHAQFASELSV